MEVEEDVLHALDALQKKRTLRGAEGLLQEERGEAFDLIDLVGFLIDRGFVLEVDGKSIENDATREGTKTFLGNIPPEAVRWVRSPLLVVAALASLLVYVAAVIHDPRVIPSYYDLFFTDRPALIIIGGLVAMLGNAFLHEMAHLLVARAYGVKSSVRLSNRLHILVLQTDVTNAWALPMRQRIHIFLAGPGYNVLMLSLTGLYLHGGLHGAWMVNEALVPYLRLFMFVNFFVIHFQFLIFLRTDLYYVFIMLLGERNLNQDAMTYLKNLITRTWKQFRNATWTPCNWCGASYGSGAAFCPGCKRVTVHYDPKIHNFNPLSSRKLLSWGVFLILTNLLAIYFLSGMAIRAQGRLLSTAYTYFLQVQEIGGWPILEGLFFLLVTALQAALPIYFLSTLAWKFTKPIRAAALRGLNPGGEATPAGGGSRRSELAALRSHAKARRLKVQDALDPTLTWRPVRGSRRTTRFLVSLFRRDKLPPPEPQDAPPPPGVLSVPW